MYPDNSDDAKELNREQSRLQETNTLHNEMINVYRQLAEQIRTFDAYLMAITVMHYHLVYAKEDLNDLPDTKMPKLSKSIAGTIEELALDAVTLVMGYRGMKAIGRRIANIVRESGSYSDSIAEGPQAVQAELAPELKSVGTQSTLVRSGNIDMLTRTDAQASELRELGEELGEGAEDLAGVEKSGDAGEIEELGDTSEAAASGAEAATEASEAAAKASEAAVEAGVEVGVEAATTAGAEASISMLGPAAVIVIIVTEIFSAIDAADTYEKLQKALASMRTMQAQSDSSLSTLKKAFKSLLISAKVDVEMYNELLAKMLSLEKNPLYKMFFKTDGIRSTIAAIDRITVDNKGGLGGFQAAVAPDLDPALEFIRKHAQHDSPMTDIVMKLKTRARSNGSSSIDDDYLKTLADVEGLTVDQVKKYNKLRQYLSAFAAVLKPFHEQLRGATPGSKIDQPKFGKPDPSFDPNPEDFIIPRMAG